MSRIRFDADEYYRRRYYSSENGNALWQNKESLEKYISRLRELMVESGDETAIKAMKDNPAYHLPQKGNITI